MCVWGALSLCARHSNFLTIRSYKFRWYILCTKYVCYVYWDWIWHWSMFLSASYIWLQIWHLKIHTPSIDLKMGVHRSIGEIWFDLFNHHYMKTDIFLRYINVSNGKSPRNTDIYIWVELNVLQRVQAQAQAEAMTSFAATLP